MPGHQTLVSSYRIQIYENIMKHDTRQKSSGVGARRRRPAVPTLSAVVVVPKEQTLHMDKPLPTLSGGHRPRTHRDIFVMVGALLFLSLPLRSVDTPRVAGYTSGSRLEYRD